MELYRNKTILHFLASSMKLVFYPHNETLPDKNHLYILAGMQDCFYLHGIQLIVLSGIIE
jgi:hypothetical protein